MSDRKDLYKNTVFLPKTDFPMRANLPQKEVEILTAWEKNNLSAEIKTTTRGREKFVLHDGPPYANGNIHIGHALNKILKDVVNRSQRMQNREVDYVPGWDCHGLPIEWKIEEKYREQKKDKDTVPILEFRRECREFAAHWINVQREEFKRLGIEGDWDNPYTTMTPAAEAQIFREIGKFLLNGSLYRGTKAVMWSVVEKTALADAEIEYHDHTSHWIYVGFSIVKTTAKWAEGAKAVIWTTTPWTMPGNRAMAYGNDIEYVAITVTTAADNALTTAGQKFIVAEKLLADFCQKTGITAHDITGRGLGSELAGSIAAHPWRGHKDAKGYYDFDVPLLAGDFVTTDAGTGLVHIAPGHGEDDFILGMKHKIEVPDTVMGDGTYFPRVPLFAGKHVFKVHDDVCAELTNAGALLARGKLVHSYPHSWRSKAPLIFRNTPQWFIAMDDDIHLRQRCLQAIDETQWFPQSGRNRIYSMVETRPDWCISRQRAWGVPIAVFTHKETGEVLRDEVIVERIAQAFAEHGSDAWYQDDPRRFLAPEYKAEDFDAGYDIVDVWFESGATHAFVLEGRDNLSWPSTLYLEGSDQHRGWFQSSLLESCGTRGTAPYKQVLTHGFVLDGEGRKMSKSMGNVTAPQEIIKEYGADILRLWVVSSDYTEDLRIGKEIIKHQVELYRRIRNTLRYVLGSLDGYTPAETVLAENMPELEQWVLHRLYELDQKVKAGYSGYKFHQTFAELHNFCATDLSAFYFDIRKDALYCDRPDSNRRRACRTVLFHILQCLTHWLAPVLVFTAEEAWLAAGNSGSVHTQNFPSVPTGWQNAALAQKWERIRAIRSVVTGALEIERREGRIGSSLESAPSVYVTKDDEKLLADLSLAEICLTSQLHLHTAAAPAGGFTLAEVPGVTVVAGMAAGEKCARCWQILPEVGKAAPGHHLCARCAGAVDLDALAA
jgi:isoleucyl-tRNA synthetase